MKMLLPYTAIITTGRPKYTLLVTLWIWIILRNTVTSRLGTARFNCGVAINGSTKQQDSKYLFIPHMHHESEEQGEEITSFFVRGLFW